MAAIDKAMIYTKETLGVTDAQMGNVRPDNTSAIIALQSASNVPLENPRALLYEWVEDIGRILLDMMGTYYGCLLYTSGLPGTANSGGGGGGAYYEYSASGEGNSGFGGNGGSGIVIFRWRW